MRSLLFALLLLLIWYAFDGWLPRLGERRGQAAGSGDSSVARIVRTSTETLPLTLDLPLSDAERGRRGRLQWLAQSAAFDEARQLAQSLMEQAASPRERAFAAGYLGARGVLADLQFAALTRGCQRGELEAAELALRRLVGLGGGARLAELGLAVPGAAEQAGSEASASGQLVKAVAELQRALAGHLPLALDGKRSLRRLDGTAWILREQAGSGGYRHHRLPLTAIDPRLLRQAFLAHFSAQAAVEAMAQIFALEGRPLAARWLRSGRLTRR